MRDCDKPLRSDNAERFTKEELEALVNRSWLYENISIDNIIQ
jgi:hypothetical protein